METVARNAAQALDAAQDPARQRPDHPQLALAGAAGRARPRRGAAADRVLRRLATCRAPTSSRRWSSSRTACRARASTAGSPITAASTGQDDVAAIHEVITRRFRRYLDERAATGERELDGDRRRRRRAAPAGIDPETGRPRKFAYPPQPRRRRRRAAAGRRRRRRRWTSSASTTSRSCGLAKRLEEVWLPGDADPVVLPRTSEGLYLLQRVRDEAHRFAITYHRQRRSQVDDESAPSTTCPGSGETRRKALLEHFGSLKRLRAATVEEIAEVPGHRAGARPRPSSRRCAAPDAPGAAPSTSATGEILEPTPSQQAACASEPGGMTRASPEDAPTLTTRLELVIITGMSGPAAAPRRSAWRTSAGSSSTTCRPALLATMVELGARVAGRRGRGSPSSSTSAAARFFADLRESLADARRPAASRPRIVFLEAADDVLVRRFEIGPPAAPAAGRRPDPRRHRRASASCCATCAATPTW